MSGRITLDGWAANKRQDAVTAQAQGGFDKGSAQLVHLLRLSKTSALYAALSGQVASKNLDSSQKFSSPAAAFLAKVFYDKVQEFNNFSGAADAITTAVQG